MFDLLVILYAMQYSRTYAKPLYTAVNLHVVCKSRHTIYGPASTYPPPAGIHLQPASSAYSWGTTTHYARGSTTIYDEYLQANTA